MEAIHHPQHLCRLFQALFCVWPAPFDLVMQPVRERFQYHRPETAAVQPVDDRFPMGFVGKIKGGLLWQTHNGTFYAAELCRFPCGVVFGIEILA